MGLLDDILLGNRGRQNRRAFVDSLQQSKVVNITERGIQLSRPDDRASTALAGHALRSVLGYTPGNFGQRVDEPIAFEPGSGTFEALTASGIKKGSSAGDLSKAATGRGLHAGEGEGVPTQLSQFLNKLLGGRGNNQRQGGVTSGLNDGASVTAPLQSFLESFNNGTDNGVPADLASILNYLDEVNDVAEQDIPRIHRHFHFG